MSGYVSWCVCAFVWVQMRVSACTCMPTSMVPKTTSGAFPEMLSTWVLHLIWSFSPPCGFLSICLFHFETGSLSSLELTRGLAVCPVTSRKPPLHFCCPSTEVTKTCHHTRPRKIVQICLFLCMKVLPVCHLSAWYPWKSENMPDLLN